MEPAVDRAREVIPRADVDQLSAEIPPTATFWIPSEDELSSDEGFGYFRDTWVIAEVAVDEAREMLSVESALIDMADELAVDATEFEDLLLALQSGDADYVPVWLLAGLAENRLSEWLGDEAIPPTYGLDLGVASVVYALGAFGCFPAASCRGHGPGGWSEYPVVYVALTADRAQRLQPMVERSACGFGGDTSRSEFLTIVAPSVSEMLKLAEIILAELDQPTSPRASERGGR